MLLGVVPSGGTCGLGLVDAGLDFAACCAEFPLKSLSLRFGGLCRRLVCFGVRQRCGACLLEFFLEFSPPGVCGLGCSVVCLGLRPRLRSRLRVPRCCAAARIAF